MSLRKILPILFLLCATTMVAQTKNQPTSRILKTAQTLLDAQQFDAAEEFYKKALQNAMNINSIYFQAQAYEGLGNLYSKTKQQTAAVSCYQKAIKLYTAINMKVIADVLNTQMKNVLGLGDLYAGVEIGAKGIKLSVIEVKMTNGENDYSLKLDTAINTDAAALSYQSEKETFDGVSLLYSIIKQRFDIPANRIHIVISSGLKQELDKYNKVEYFATVIRPKDLDPLIRIRYVNVDEEAQLSFKGIVPQMNRHTANQLDIGSGNTKGGYLNASRGFIPVTFPVGTKSFQRLVESQSPANTLELYKETAEQLIADSLGQLMIAHFRDKTDFKSRDVVYLSGGIVWCITSLMYPELIKQNHVELSLQDIADFREKVYTNYNELIQPDLRNKLNDADAAASFANIKKVVNTYDQKALLVGSIWLSELLKEVNSLNPNKKFIFPRYAYVGWISGYIIDKISKQYTEVAIN